jgi:hypothetical protein
VTEAALAHQFVSLGRFSELYSRQFGELPSETQPNPALKDLPLGLA